VKTDPAYDLTIAILATANAFLRESGRLFRPYGLTGAQYNVLNILAVRPDGISQRELGDLLVVDRSNVTGLLDRMEKAGWVRRDDDPADRRVYRIGLTAAGRALREKVNPLYLDVVHQITHGIAPKKMTDCAGLLQELELRAPTWQLPAASTAEPDARRPLMTAGRS
jgi:DNA-binding MarR family transcriptional regulator